MKPAPPTMSTLRSAKVSIILGASSASRLRGGSSQVGVYRGDPVGVIPSLAPTWQNAGPGICDDRRE
jgi:hypothetical protein